MGGRCGHLRDPRLANAVVWPDRTYEKVRSLPGGDGDHGSGSRKKIIKDPSSSFWNLNKKEGQTWRARSPNQRRANLRVRIETGLPRPGTDAQSVDLLHSPPTFRSFNDGSVCISDAGPSPYAIPSKSARPGSCGLLTPRLLRKTMSARFRFRA